MQIKIQNWLRNQTFVETSDGPAIRYTLCHMTEESKLGLQVVSVDARGEDPGNEWIEDTASFLEQAAISDAEGIGGVQTYVVLCYREKSPDKVSARCVVRANGGDATDEYGHINSEPPTEKGLVRQQMRHNEALAKVLMSSTSSVLRHCETTINKLSHQNEILLNQRLETFTLIEDLQSQRHERELKALESENRKKLLSDGFDTVKQLAPAILSRVKGGSELQIEALKQFLNSLDETQQSSIFNSLTQTQQIALGELLQSFTKKGETS